MTTGIMTQTQPPTAPASLADVIHYILHSHNLLDEYSQAAVQTEPQNLIWTVEIRPREGLCGFSKPLFISIEPPLRTVRIAQSFADVWEVAYDPILEFRVVEAAGGSSEGSSSGSQSWELKSVYRWHEGQTVLSSAEEREGARLYVEEFAGVLLERGYHDVRQAVAVRVVETPAVLREGGELKKGVVDSQSLFNLSAIMKFTLLTSLLAMASSLTTVRAQMPNLDSLDSIVDMSNKAIRYMQQYYYSDANDGAWSQKIVQWHESGMYYDVSIALRILVKRDLCILWTGYHTIFAHRAYALKNPTDVYPYDDWINMEMIKATFRDQGDFLDGADGPGSTIFGKWNDDILWWAMAALTATEIFGPNAVVDPQGLGAVDGVGSKTGRPWLEVAARTWNHALEQWDTTTCGGGIYWSRNRNAARLNQRFYKSSITNAQAIEVAARLYEITKNQTYVEWADRLYDWMKKTVMLPDYSVLDGVMGDDPNSCGPEKLERDLISYTPACMLVGLGQLFVSTKQQKYIDEAHQIFDFTMRQFVDPANNVIIEPVCVPGGPLQTIDCKIPNGFTLIFYKALGKFHAMTPDPARKKRIEDVIKASARANFETCPDKTNWNCVRQLSPVRDYMYENGTNPRDQFDTMELINALALINGAKTVQTIQTGPQATRPKSSATGVVSGFGWLSAVGAAVVGLLV
ncbi:hydrolase 76 protein [Chytridiales sp. JEL 0842]|nr:hydrolase 76 protein [Chytridiales sp. JEL 0842]